MSEKISGYILLGVGLMIILFSFSSVLIIIFGNTKPINIFNLPGVSLNLESLIGGGLVPKGKESKAEIVAPEIINQPLNLIAHIIIAGFLVNGGFKIASLGVQFLRPIKVNLKSSP